MKAVRNKVLYKGQPARNYDYSYFDGRDWSNSYSAKDGTGIIELPALANISGLPIKTEYMFEGEANVDNELVGVFAACIAANTLFNLRIIIMKPRKRTENYNTSS